MKWFLMIVGLLLAMIGLTELIHDFKMYWLTPHGIRRNVSVVCINDEEDAVRQLQYAGEQMNWIGISYRIAAYGDALSEEKRNECRRIARQYDMIFCPICAVGSLIANL